MDTENLLEIIRHRRSVRVYKTGKVSDQQLETILEAARWAPSGANTQPWEFVVTRDRKKMKKVREIYSQEWRDRKKEDPVHYKGLKKDYVGDVSVLVLACGEARTKQVYLTTRQTGRPGKTVSGEHRQRRAASHARRRQHEPGHGVGVRA